MFIEFLRPFLNIPIIRKLGYLFRALDRKFGLDFSFRSPSSELRGLIISPGGVATTFLITAVSKFSPVNDKFDLDGLKHLPRLPPSLVGRDDLPILFIKGDADQIVRSLTRRGFLDAQLSKLGVVRLPWWTDSQSQLALREAIFDQLQNYSGYRNVLIVDYIEIWDNLQLIAKHLGISENAFIENFPKQQPRTHV